MHIRKRISGLALALLTVVCSGAFTMYDHVASASPAGGTPVAPLLSAAPLFASTGTIASAFAGTRTPASTISVTIAC